MVTKTSRTLVPLAAAAIALVIAAWFDGTVMRDALQHLNAALSGLHTTIAFGLLLVAGSVLLLGVLAWRSASVVVGLAYVVAGGLFVALPWLWWNLTRYDAPPGVPEALAWALRNLFYLSTGGSDKGHSDTGGPLNAVGMIGAAMLVAGIATVARWWRGRAVAASRAGVVVPTADPTLP